MFLRSLVLRGFKSFADKVLLELEPGITVVVGPNGSGKSNIVDAISWVLGEQGPRSLRGGRMEDVIFAGSRLRPALGMAEVALTIDNSARLLPVEFSEVTISRMLFRSGESEYRINGAPCRLLDIQELLSDTGIGREQHTVVGQGQLDAVLTADPSQIRSFIEEAAGISKHRRRRERALRRIAAAEASLTRVLDLAAEIRRQLRPLREQAEVARRHAAAAEELSRLRFVASARELAGVRARLGPGAALDLDAGVAEAEQGLRRHEGLAGEAEETLRRAVAHADAARETSWALGRLRDRLAALSRLSGERERGLRAEMASATEAGVRAQLEALEREHAATEAEAADAARAAGEAVAGERGRREALDAAERHLEEIRRDLDTRRAEHREAAVDEVRLRGDVESLGGTLDAAERERSRLAERAAAMTSAAGDTRARIGQVQAELESLEAAEAPVAQELAVEETALRSLEAELAAGQGRLRDAEREAAVWGARALVRGEGGTDEARRVAALSIEGVAGVLADLVDVAPEYRAALDALAGPAGAVLVAADAAAAGRALEAADAEGAVGVIWAGRPAVEVPATPLASVVRMGHPVAAAALSGVFLADSAPQAAALANDHPAAVFVTRAGTVAAARLAVASPAGTGLRAADAEDERALAAQAVSAVESSLAAARRRHGDAATRLNEVDAAIAAAGERLAALEREGHAAEREGRAVAEALERAEQAAASSRERLEHAGAALPESQRRIAGATRHLDRLREDHAAAEANRREAAGSLDDARLLAARAAERGRIATGRLEALSAGLEAARESVRTVAGRRTALGRRIERAGWVAAAAAALAEAAGRWVQEAGGAQAAFREGVQRAEQAVARLRSERAALAEALDGLRVRAREEDLARTELRIRGRILEERLREEWEAEPGDAARRFGHRWDDEDAQRSTDPMARIAALDDEALGRRRARLERDLASIGRVNPLAAQEFEALSQREEYLAGQVADVRASRRDLLKVVASIDERIRGLFEEAYSDVAREYERLFAVLFPGGRGRLRLSDPADLLAAGVEVEARPGGKNLRRLSLLSGGERALAALAFLFAIFRARPSPFYVLDEVEAALDDVNLQRFLRLLQEFRDASQLIVVTHQKRTMEVADILYGVSIRPEGASRVISQRLASAGSAQRPEPVHSEP